MSGIRPAPERDVADPAAGAAEDLPEEGGEQAGAFGARLMTPLLLGAVLNPVNSTMIATALVAIGRAFHVGAADTAWLVGALYLASAVAQPPWDASPTSSGPAVSCSPVSSR